MEMLSQEPGHCAAIDALLDRCFGPARARRAASLLRIGAAPVGHACLVAVEAGRLVGSVACHQLAFCGDGAAPVPLVWLGPLAVDPSRRGEGIGARLMEAALGALGDEPVALIGDAPYYARWGFRADCTSRWRLPGPVDRARLLLRGGDPRSFARPGAPAVAAGCVAA